MDTFLWPELLIDFYNRKPTDDERQASETKGTNWDSLYFFFKTKTNLFININLDSYNYSDESNPFNKLLPLLTSGRDKSLIKLDSKCFEIFQNKIFQNKLENTKTIVGFPSKIEKEVLDANGVMIWTKDDYYEKWKQIKKIQEENDKGITVGKDDKIKKWGDLGFLKHPCTDIVISDRYILKNKKRALYTLQGILNNIFDVKSQKPNLLIITKYNETFEKEIENLYTEINSYLISKNILVELSIAIDNSNILEHDRKIFSNYFFLDSGDSWDYFEESGNLKTTGTSINASALLGKSGIYSMQQSLREAKKVIENQNSSLKGKISENIIFNYVQ